MNFDKFQSLARSVSLGKHLPDAIYLHESALETASSEMCRFICEKIIALDLQEIDWNII